MTDVAFGIALALMANGCGYGLTWLAGRWFA
jgi:hypothetical protein